MWLRFSGPGVVFVVLLLGAALPGDDDTRCPPDQRCGVDGRCAAVLPGEGAFSVATSPRSAAFSEPTEEICGAPVEASPPPPGSIGATGGVCYPVAMRVLLPALLTVGLFAGCDADTKASVNKALGRYRAYDGKAVAAEQLQAAQARAKAEGKRVLVQFGGNWCVFCQALDELIEHDATLKGLKAQYVAIHIDAANAEDLNQRWGKPFDHGFPVLVVVDADGAPLHTQPMTAFIRGGGFDTVGVTAFLKAWVRASA